MDEEVDHHQSSTQANLESMQLTVEHELSRANENFVNALCEDSNAEAAAFEPGEVCGSSQLSDVNLTYNDNELCVVISPTGIPHNSEQMPPVQNDMNEHVEQICDEVYSRCSNSSEQSLSTEEDFDSDRNNNGQVREMPDVLSCRIQDMPKRVAARRAEATINTYNDIDDDSLDCGFNYDYETLPTRRRKMTCFEDDEVASSYRLACRELNKNAMNARLNRQKKKAYIASLENRQSQLSGENMRLKSSVEDLTAERNRLADEVDYLRAVLANDSALARLINGINGVNSVHLTSRFDNVTKKRLRNVEVDHSYTPMSKTRKIDNSKCGGVCLHVQQSRMSLEFCEQCAQMSSGV